MWREVGSAFFFGITSISMTLLNKGLFSFDFSAVTFLILCQFIATASLLPLFTQITMDRKKMTPMIPVALAYSVQTVVSLWALKLMNIAMYSVMKRMTIVFVLIGEALLLSIWPTVHILASVSLLVSGALIAGRNDLTASAIDYIVCFVACMLQASHSLIYKRACRSAPEITIWEQMFYTSVLSIPAVFFACVVSGEFSAALNSPVWTSYSFIAVFTSCVLLGNVLVLSSYLCTRCNSPLTSTVVGQTKSVVQIIIGLTLLGAKTNPGNLLGICLNSCGSALYAYRKYVEREAAKHLPT